MSREGGRDGWALALIGAAKGSSSSVCCGSSRLMGSGM